MKLPTQGQVNAATRHLASFAGWRDCCIRIGTEGRSAADDLVLTNGLGALSGRCDSYCRLTHLMVAALYAARASRFEKPDCICAGIATSAAIIVTDPKLASPFAVIVDPTAPLTPRQK